MAVDGRGLRRPVAGRYNGRQPSCSPSPWAATVSFLRHRGTISREASVDELARYLLEHAYIDFQGDLDLDQVREFLRRDDSREARLLLAKLIEENGVDDLMITIADCLKDYIRTGIDERIVKEQLLTYGES